MEAESQGSTIRRVHAGEAESRSFGLRKRREARKSRRLSYSRRLGIEPLEERRMLAAYLVNTELDSVDPNDGLTSLREAIASANAAPGADTIDFDASLAGKTILLTRGELEVSDSLAINGFKDQTITIDAQQQSRVIHFSAQNGDLSIYSMKLTGGKTTGNDTNPNGGWQSTFNGGAIRSASVGTLGTVLLVCCSKNFA